MNLLSWGLMGRSREDVYEFNKSYSVSGGLYMYKGESFGQISGGDNAVEAALL
jgi:hypothetical protein